MMNNYKRASIHNGKVAPLVITNDYVLHGIHAGGVEVEAGDFTLQGTIQGSLDIQSGVVATINGNQQGSLSINENAIVAVTGSIQGSVSVQPNATLIIELHGKLAGSLFNLGLVIVRGVFGGNRSGDGEFRLEGTGYVKQPTIRNGTAYYNW